MTDVWVCGTCHSLNRQRNARCYKCGAKQVEADTGVLADTRTRLALQQRTAVRYRSSMLRALIASGFILAVAVLNLIVLVVGAPLRQFVREQVQLVYDGGEFDTAALAAGLAPGIGFGVALQVTSLIALICFAAWLSRVVMNIPALGGGMPRSTPTRAFIYPFIPIVNLIKVPPMIQDALYRLDPKAGGFFMIMLAWVGLIGSAIVRFLADNWQRLRVESIVRNAETREQMLDDFLQVLDVDAIVTTITAVMISAGAVVLVVIMLRIEARARARDQEIRAAAAGAGGEALMPVRMPDPDPERPTEPAPPFVGPVTAAAAAGPSTSAEARTAETVPAPSALPLAAAPPAIPAAPPPAAPTTPIGPRLGVTVLPDGIRAWVDESPAEPSTVDELRAAAPALAQAGGSATVTAIPGADPATVHAIVDALRAAGVPTQER